MYKISVITSFYRGNKYIDSLIENISENARNLKAVYSDSCVEFIIVNDSPETKVNLPEKINGIECRVINHEKNMGIHQGRITGLRNCTGDYILILDQDDTIDNNFFVQQLPYMNEHDVVVANAYIEKADKTLTPLYKNKNSLKKVLNVQSYIKSHNQIASPGQCLIKKTCIPEEWYRYVVKTNGSDDLFLWLLLFYSNAKFTVNNKCLYTHKYTGENLSDSGEKMNNSSLEIAGFLKEISWIPKEILDPYIRSRNLISDFRKSSILNKFRVVLKNLDLILFRLIWKIKCL